MQSASVLWYLNEGDVALKYKLLCVSGDLVREKDLCGFAGKILAWNEATSMVVCAAYLGDVAEWSKAAPC